MDSQPEISEMDIWYEPNGRHRLLTRNGFLNFVVGGRGTGKTFSFKKWAITDPRYETVWIRRYQDDVERLEKKFLSDLYGEGVLTPEDDVRIEDHVLYIGKSPKIYFVGLNTARKVKSQSFHNVDKIIYDEVFELEKNAKYLKMEVDLFLELLETVNRLRVDGRREVRCFFLSNKTTFVNPYFTYWGIIPFEGEFKTFKDGLIVVQNYENESFKEVKRQTNFGRLVAGTKYGDYAVENKVWLDDNGLLEKKPANCRLICNIRWEDKYLGVWESPNMILYVSNQYNKGNRPTFTTKYEVKDDEYPLIPKNNPFRMLVAALENGVLRFEDNVVKNIIYLIIQQGGK